MEFIIEIIHLINFSLPFSNRKFRVILYIVTYVTSTPIQFIDDVNANDFEDILMESFNLLIECVQVLVISLPFTVEKLIVTFYMTIYACPYPIEFIDNIRSEEFVNLEEEYLSSEDALGVLPLDFINSD